MDRKAPLMRADGFVKVGSPAWIKKSFAVPM